MFHQIGRYRRLHFRVWYLLLNDLAKEVIFALWETTG